MSLIFSSFSSSGRSPFCASTSGWSAIQLWAGTIASCEAAQVQGFPITARYLADVFERAGAESIQTDGIRTAPPPEVSRLILDLDGTEASRRAGDLVSDRFERRLVADAVRLRRLIQGDSAPSSGIAAFYRIRVIDKLALTLIDTVPGFGRRDREANAGIRAGIAANETVRFADRYFDATERTPRPSRESRRKLIRQIRFEISQITPAALSQDMASAFEEYLAAAGLDGDLI